MRPSLLAGDPILQFPAVRFAALHYYNSLHLPTKKQVTKVESNKSRMQIIRCNLSFQFRPSFQTGSLDDNWAIISDNLELQENFQFCL